MENGGFIMHASVRRRDGGRGEEESKERIKVTRKKVKKREIKAKPREKIC